MAAAAWKVYNSAKKYLQNGTLDMDTTTFKMALYKSTSNASTYTISTAASLTNQVSTNIKSPAAKTMTSVSIRLSTSATTVWDAADVVFSASGGTVGSIMYAVIYVSGGKVICWSKLSSAIFSVTTGNTLTVGLANANSIWQLTGG